MLFQFQTFKYTEKLERKMAKCEKCDTDIPDGETCCEEHKESTEEKPAEDTPAEEKPAEDTPAEEKPAGDAEE